MTTVINAKRPTLLTVLCVLSFIGGAIGLWGGVRTVFFDGLATDLAKAEKQLADLVEEQGTDAPGYTMLEEQVAVSRCVLRSSDMIGYANLIGAVLTIAGAVLMWQLRRSGFWLYLAGTLVTLAELAPMLDECGSTFTNFAAGVSVLAGVVMVVLYAVNLKHMR